MKGITWSRDSHGLFDYESRHLTKRTMRAQEATKISRQSNELETIPMSVSSDTNLAQTLEKTSLLKINQSGSKSFYCADQIFLEGCVKADVNNLNNNDQMYLVIRSLKSGNDKIDYHIKKGDILKIGRVKFAVKLMNIIGQEQVTKKDEEDLEFQEFLELKDNILTTEEQVKAFGTNEEDLPKCKCCWESHATLDDPLFIPCVCKSSHIHLSCLKIWMN